MKQKSTFKKVTNPMALTFLILVILIVLFFQFTSGDIGKPPKDAEMVEAFEKNKLTFYKLADIISNNEEEFYSISQDTNLVIGEIDIQDLLKTISVKSGHKIVGSQDIRFIRYSKGGPTNGKVKGYYYSPNEKMKSFFDSNYLVENLDTKMNQDAPCYFLRKLDDSWYLYFEKY